MKTRVAVVDTGINASRLTDIVISRQYDFTSGKMQLADSMNDGNGHGTTCAKIIGENNPNIEIYDIKVLDDRRCGKVSSLVSALEFLENTDVEIINMSLAFTDKNGELYIKNICEDLLNKGKIIVASMDNAGKKAYPACLRNVIGVCGNDYHNKCTYKILDEKNVTVQADNNPVIYEWADKRVTILGGTSKAAAVVSNQLIMNRNNKGESFVQILKKNECECREEGLEEKEKLGTSDLAKSDYEVLQKIVRCIPCRQINKGKLYDLKLWNPIFELKTSDYIKVIEELMGVYDISIDTTIPVMDIVDTIYSLERFVKNGKEYKR